VVVKQFNFSTDYDTYAVELEILTKIKSLKLKFNGSFPYVLSAKSCDTHGEILMTSVGEYWWKQLSFNSSLTKPVNPVGWDPVILFNAAMSLFS
jgi:hypothetical protein